jgi:uncharacterized membrane protein
MRRFPSLILAVVTVAVAFVLAAPLLRVAGADRFADALFALFGHVCHQAPERSLQLLGHPLAVCGRCTGLYLGLLLALLVLRTWRSERPGVAIAALVAAPVLIAVDVGLAALGSYDSSLFARALTGVVLGAGIATVLVHARSTTFTTGLGLQLGALVLLAVPLLACKARDKPVKKDGPPAKVAPKPPELTQYGCASDTDCKGNRVCVDGECADRDVPIIVEVPAGCARDTDCKGNRVCVDGECREPAVPPTTVVEVRPSTTCDDCPGKCLAIKQKCNDGSVRDCFLAGACMCECKLAAGGCGSTPDELRSCISTNRAKARP